MENTTYAIMTQKTFVKKEGTKTVWVLESKEVKNFTEEQYNNMTSADTRRFFRGLGGKESFIKGYTSKGYKITEMSSTNPDQTIKKVRSFAMNLDQNGNRL